MVREILTAEFSREVDASIVSICKLLLNIEQSIVSDASINSTMIALCFRFSNLRVEIVSQVAVKLRN